MTTCIVFFYLWELSLTGPSILFWKMYLCSGCGYTCSWAPASIKIKETLSCRRCFFPHLGALQYNSGFRDLVLHLSQSSYDMPSRGWRTQVCSLISHFSLSGLPCSVRGANYDLATVGASDVTLSFIHMAHREELRYPGWLRCGHCPWACLLWKTLNEARAVK